MKQQLLFPERCVSPYKFFCLLFAICVFPGCSDSTELAIPLDSKPLYSSGSHSVLEPHHAALICPGDINGDGVSDMIVGTARRRITTHRNCKIAAYSGIDGAVLWQMDGQPENDSGDFRGFVSQIYLVDDLDGDQFPDVYGLWKRSSTVMVYLFSGKTGKLIHQHDFEEKSYPGTARPIVATQPVASGAPALSLLFVEKQHPKVSQFNPTNFELLRTIDIADGDTKFQKAWALTNFGDDDHDGTGDHLLRVGINQSYTDDVYQYEMYILSGKDFHTIRTFRTNRPRMGTSEEGYVVLGDVNGDGKDDFAYASNAGATSNKRVSHIRAFSGADGDSLWELDGSQIEGSTTTTIPVDPKDAQSWNDCNFSGEALALPDRNGDGIGDLLTLNKPKIDGEIRTQLVLISGKDGSLLGMEDPTDKPTQKRFTLVKVPNVNREGDPGVAFITYKPSVVLHVHSVPIVD